MTVNHDQLAADIDAAEEANAREVGLHRHALRARITEADIQVRHALHELANLLDTYLYDAELDGQPGNDVKANLEDAGRLLRSTLALAPKPEA